MPESIIDLVKKYNQINRSRWGLLGVGVDEREDGSDTRLKVWSTLYQDPELIRYLAEDEQVDPFFVDDCDGGIIGFDFCINGPIKKKLYIRYQKNSLVNLINSRKTEQLLSEKAVDLMRLSHRRIHLAFSKERGVILHLYPSSIWDFNQAYRIEGLDALSAKIECGGERINSVALYARDIENNHIREFNIYY